LAFGTLLEVDYVKMGANNHGVILQNLSFCVLNFANLYKWVIYFLFLRNEIISLPQVIKFSDFLVKIWNYYDFWRKSEENSYWIRIMLKKISKFHCRHTLQCRTSQYKIQFLCHFIIRKFVECSCKPSVQFAIKISHLRKFSKFQIEVGTKLNKLHFVSLSQIQKNPL